jgi:hypothetical protein
MSTAPRQRQRLSVPPGFGEVHRQVTVRASAVAGLGDGVRDVHHRNIASEGNDLITGVHGERIFFVLAISCARSSSRPRLVAR